MIQTPCSSKTLIEHHHQNGQYNQSRRKDPIDPQKAIQKIVRLQHLASQLQFRKSSEKRQLAMKMLVDEFQDDVKERDLQYVNSFVSNEGSNNEKDRGGGGSGSVSQDNSSDNNDRAIIPAVDLDEQNDGFDARFWQNCFGTNTNQVQQLSNNSFQQNEYSSSSTLSSSCNDNMQPIQLAALLFAYQKMNNYNSNSDSSSQEEISSSNAWLSNSSGRYFDQCNNYGYSNSILTNDISQQVQLRHEETMHNDFDESRRKKRETQRKYRERLKQKDPIGYRLKKKEQQKRYLARLTEERREEIRQKHRETSKRYREQLRTFLDQHGRKRNKR